MLVKCGFFFFSSRRRHTRWNCDWSSDVCSSDLLLAELENRDLVGAATESRGQLAQAESSARVTTASVPEQMTKAQTDVDAARAATDAAQKLVDSRQQLLRDGAIARKLVDDAQV